MTKGSHPGKKKKKKLLDIFKIVLTSSSPCFLDTPAEVFTDQPLGRISL